MATSSNNTTIVISVNDPTWGEVLFSGLATLVIGLCGIVVNVLTAAVIANNKKLRSPCFGLIAGHALFCFSMAIGSATNGCERLSLIFHLSDFVYNRLSCALRYVTYLFSIPPSSVMTCVIGLERTMAILFPQIYQQRGKNLVIISLASLSFVGLISVSAAFLTAPGHFTDKIYCHGLFAPVHAMFTLAFTNFNLAFLLLSILIYSTIFAVVKYRKYKQNLVHHSNSTKTETAQFLQRQLKLLPMINTLMVAYCFFGLTPSLMVSSFTVIDNGNHLARATLYSSVLKAALPCIDFFVLTVKCADFRSTLKKWMRIGTNAVTSLAASEQ